MRGCQHEDYFFLFINFIKETLGPDPVTPCFWFKIFELFYVRAEVKMFTELWINEKTQFLNNLGISRSGNLYEIRLKLGCFKYPVITRQSALFLPWHHGSLS